MTEIAGVILAGGTGQRLGGQDKAQLNLNGRSLITQSVSRLRAQCDVVAVSLRTAPVWRLDSDVEFIFDTDSTSAGPLAGIAASLHWAANLKPQPAWLVTLPVDVPFFPDDVVSRLTAVGSDVAIARCVDQRHYAVAAWRTYLSDSVGAALARGERALKTIQLGLDVSEVEWPAFPYDPFLNINSPDDLKRAERIAQSL